MQRYIIVALLLLLFGVGVFAQVNNTGPSIGASISISANNGGSTSGNLASNTVQFPAALIFNDGSVEAFFRVGSPAGTTDTPLSAGSGICVGVNNQTIVAAITATSTTTLRITQMTSCPSFSFAGSGGGGGGSGGSVTQGSIPWVTSESVTALVPNVNCIAGCAGSAASTTGVYNQNPAILPSGATSNLQMDQVGALKVNITSQLVSTLTVSNLAGTLSWPPGTASIINSAATGSLVPMPVYAGTLTTSPAAGSVSWPPGSGVVGIAGTVVTSGLAGSLATITSPQVGSLAPIGVVGIGSTVTTSAVSGSNFIAPIAIGLATTSAQTGSLVPTGIVGISSTVVVSNSAGSLVPSVNCIAGCSGAPGSTTGTYNQNPAILVSGATSGLQMDQVGALKVNITSQLVSTLTVSQQSGTLVPQPVYAGTLTTSAVTGSNFVAPIAIGSSPTLTVSETTGGNFIAPVAIGSAPTLTTSATAGTNNVQVNGFTVTATVSQSAGTLLPQPIYAGTLTTSSVTGGNFVAPVAIGSAPTLATSPASGTLIWPPGTIVVSLTAPTTGGCTSQVVTSTTTNIFTQIKSTGGILCSLNYSNATSSTISVRLYNTAVNGNLACSGSGGVPVIMLATNSGTVTAGSTGGASPATADLGMGPYGIAFPAGIGLCITGSAAANNKGGDVTSSVTGLNVNLSFK